MTDAQVLARLKGLARKERAITLHLLLYLNEVERRELYAPLGYATMFAFLTRHLQYSESGAARRLRVARCFREYPELVPMFRRREVNMSTVCAISGALTSSNRSSLIAAVRGKSRREVDVLLAREQPPVRVVDSIRPTMVRKPTGSPAQLPMRSAESHCQSDSGDRSNAHGQSDSRAPGDSGSPSPQQPAQAEAAQEMRIVRFAAQQEFVRKLEAVRALLSTRHPNGIGLADTIDAALEAFLDTHDPARRQARREQRRRARAETRRAVKGARRSVASGAGAARTEAPQAGATRAAVPHAGAARTDPSGQERNASGASQRPQSSRYIPSAIRDAVAVRDGGRCTYRGPDGVRCNSRHNVQVDHVRPHALGGAASEQNLRLLCAKHNRLAAKRMFGDPHARRAAAG